MAKQDATRSRDGACNPAVTIDVDAETANAIVEAIAIEVTSEADNLHELHVSTVPGDLFEIERSCGRISRLAAINDQLRWRAHHGHHRSAEEIAALDLKVSSDEETVLDVARLLRYWADHWSDDDDHRDRFTLAARAVARAVGEIEVAR